MRRIVGLVAEFLNFICKRGAVISFWIVGKEKSLALVIPIVGSESLRFLEMRDGFRAVALVIEKFCEAEFGISQQAIRTGGSEALAEFVFLFAGRRDGRQRPTKSQDALRQ